MVRRKKITGLIFITALVLMASAAGYATVQKAYVVREPIKVTEVPKKHPNYFQVVHYNGPDTPEFRKAYNNIFGNQHVDYVHCFAEAYPNHYQGYSYDNSYYPQEWKGYPTNSSYVDPYGPTSSAYIDPRFPNCVIYLKGFYPYP